MAGDIKGGLQVEEQTVAVLRQDLTLYPAEANEDGSPAWILHDPLANRHFHIGSNEIELLELMGRGGENVLDSVDPDKRESVSEQLEELYLFLRQNNLTVADTSQRKWYLRQQILRHSSGVLAKLAKSYLFIRIPVWSPDRFLDKTIRYVLWLGKPVVRKVLAALLVIGVFSALRQSNTFVSTFLHFFTFQGAAIYLFTLFAIKVIHEMGHAYVAKAMGCRVPIIGVAFLVGWPVLYTDTSDSWKLASREKRMKIGIAGVGIEVGIAIAALFLWGLAPEGMVKSVLFILATTTWILSVLINFNPLMRFDGYYLLSDWLRVPNLEPRSMAMAKYWLREKLFAFGFEPPEPIKRKLVFYAISIWIYRFFLFLGIALLVYFFFFKLLGIILFLVEIIYFIGRPIYREVSVWWSFRKKMFWNRNTITTASGVIFLLFLGFIPWSNSFTAPSQLDVRFTQLYYPVTGKIDRILVVNGKIIEKGELMLEVTAPDLNHEISQLRRRFVELNWSRQSLGFDPELRKQALIVASELASQNQRLRGKLIDRERLQIFSPHAGTVVNKEKDLAVGDWMSKGQSVFAVLDASQAYVTAYVAEEVIGRLTVGDAGVFYPEKGNWGSFSVEITDIDTVGIRVLDTLYVASVHGGELAVRGNDRNELVPISGTYKVRMKVIELGYKPGQVIRGSVKIFGASESFFVKIKRKVVALLRRESGF